MLITLHVMAFVPLTVAFLVGYAAGYVNVGLVIVGATQLLYALPGFQDHNEIGKPSSSDAYLTCRSFSMAVHVRCRAGHSRRDGTCVVHLRIRRGQYHRHRRRSHPLVATSGSHDVYGHCANRESLVCNGLYRPQVPGLGCF